MKPSIPPPPVPTQLIVFADDWGRHPSSSQHLIRELLPQYPTLWVNTVGTRKPRFNMADLKRGMQKVWNVLSASDAHIDHMHPDLPENLCVIEPFMYPGFRTGWQRRFNRRKLTKAIHGCLGESWATMPLFQGKAAEQYRRVAITTLPITADLVGQLNVDRWVYYCVDDYSQWPGADHAVIDAMDRQLIPAMDAVACVSETLLDRVASLGAVDAWSLTHGVKLESWTSPAAATRLSKRWPEENVPMILFWGLIDARLEVQWLGRLALERVGKPVLVGPSVSDDVLQAAAGSVHVGPVEHDDLPAYAEAASVLVMPYIDAPVTRAMQPLKLLEYLATMKPVVVRDLPSTRAWADCCDLASTGEAFVELVAERARLGTPPEQLEARRRRLPGESWQAKAAQLAELINAG